MSVALTVAPISAAPGGSVEATLKLSATGAVAHHTVVKMAATNATATIAGTGKLGDVGTALRTVAGTVRIPAKAVTGVAALTATVTADLVGRKTTTQTITISAVPGSANVYNPNLPFTGVNPNTTTQSAQVALPVIAQDPSIAPVTSVPFTLTALRTDLGNGPWRAALITTSDSVWLTTLLIGVMWLIARIRARRREIVLAGRPGRHPGRHTRRIQRLRRRHLGHRAD